MPYKDSEGRLRLTAEEIKKEGLEGNTKEIVWWEEVLNNTGTRGDSRRDVGGEYNGPTSNKNVGRSINNKMHPKRNQDNH
jgi:hypothetical protein